MMDLESGYLPIDEEFQRYVGNHSKGSEQVYNHYTLDTPSAPHSKAKVSGWIENDRSLYFLHEIGIL